ncbi:GEVED domain-containing protein [Flavobacterium sp. U410]
MKKKLLDSTRKSFAQKEKVNFLLMLFFIFFSLTNNLFSQGTTCDTATSITINGACITSSTANITDATQNTPTATGCSIGTFRREGWYTFTITGGPLDITITAESNNRNLFLQLISSTSACTGLTQIACANDDTANNSAQTETITQTLSNGIYYIKVLNVGGDNNMRLNSICVTGSAASGYCTPSSTNTSDYISSFTTTGGVTNINNNSGGLSGTGYGDFYTTHSTSQYPGSSLNFTETYNGGSHGFNIWVDWNNDGTFATTEKVFASTSTDTGHSGSFTIPGGQAAGDYRMRIRGWWNNNNPDPCTSISYGEAEDYKLTVLALPSCSGTPTAGTTTTSPTNGAPGSSYTVSASGFTNASGLTYQWQYSTDGGSSWTNEGTTTSSYSNYTATAPSAGTTVTWQLIITCTGSSQTATSTTATFTSVSSINVPATGNNSLSCGTNTLLYDNGGPSGNYANSSSGYTVLQAGAAGIINISGSYTTESGYDYIRIYNGTGTGGTLLASYSGTGSINYTGTAGQTLTVQFYSDSSSNYSGFSLAVSYGGACTLSPCTGTPTAGTVTTNPNTDWPGASYTVSATGYSLATGLTYQWQYSINGGTTWINAGSATSSYANYNATAPASGEVQWQLVVTCTNSGQVATSAIGVFTTMEVSDVATGCPNVVSGGLGLSGADPSPFNCSDTSTCVDLEATYLDLGDTTSYIVEPIAYNPPFAFNNLANPVSVNVDDVWSPTVNLPFNFCFYGNTYTQCLIGSNGVITFDTINNTAGGTCSWSFDANLPVAGDTALVENAIFGVFHDIDPGVGGEVGWELITLPSGCRALVASWYNVPLFGDNSKIYTGMMVLYENSNVIEVYIKNKPIDPDDWNDNNAVVGIQNATGTLASVAPARNGLDTDWVTANEAWRFVPNGNSIASLTWHEGSGVSGPVIGTTDILNVCPTVTTTYTAEITYTLCDGRTITEVDETTVTVNGSKVWNGSVSTDWNNDNNWTPTGKPTALDCVVIPDTSNDPIISGSGYNGLGLNMSILNNAALTVNSNNAVTITDWVNINTTGNLVLDNAASLVQVNDIANLGSGTMQMDRGVNIRKLDYVYWSSPVTSFTSSAISPNTLGYIYKWNPTITTNLNGFGNWVSGTENMVIGKGYIVRGPNNYTSSLQNFTATFTGTPNNGTLTTLISRGSYTGADYTTCTTCTLATKDDDNWNLVGNPYPSAVNAINFLTDNTNIAGFIKLWTHGTLPSSAIADPFYDSYVYNYTPGDYLTYNITGTSSGPGIFNGYIAAGQGFFVLMNDTGASSQNITFNNNMRDHSYNNGEFFRTSNTRSTTNKNRIWLDLVSPNNASVRTLIGYVDGATDGEDRLYDAITDRKLALNLFSLIENEKMSIQGRSLPFNNNDQVPLGITIPEDGIYSIAIGTLDGLFEESQDIYLEDLANNIIHDLRAAPYSFNAAVGTYDNRFVLRYTNTNNSTLSTEAISDANNNVWTITQEQLKLQSNNFKIKSVKVFDVLGRLIEDKNDINDSKVVFDSLLKSNTTLLLQIELENGVSINKKVIF